VGDLSGKHGTIPALPGFSANYSDKYVSLTPGTPAFLGDRSIVLHYANKTRIACANFNFVQKTSNSSSGSSNSSTPSGGLIGSSPSAGKIPPSGAPTVSPAATTGGSGARGASNTDPTGTAKPSGTAASSAMGMKVTHKKMILGPLLAGAAVMVL
jgi:hypothetical protein